MLRVGFKTDTGRVRENNQDSLFVLPEQKLYIVADGVGGHNSGEIASRMAVQQIAAYVAEHPIEQAGDDNRLKDYFLDCLRVVNRQICQAAAGEVNKGMATTVVVVYLRQGHAYVVNVGDSRAYLVRDKVIRQITEDHTYVNELLKKGNITRGEALNHPQRNMITRALGGDSSVLPDFFQFEIYTGDLILMCTDGLYGEVSDEEISHIATGRRSMHRLANDYVRAANEHGGNDNVTVICIKI